MEGKLSVYHLHGLGSSCSSTKATLVKELSQSFGFDFTCFEFDYLKKDLPWEVLNFLNRNVDKSNPVILVGSSMGSYTWLDFLVHNEDIFKNPNFKMAILITPPTTLFDNLEKWNPIFGREKLFLRYGEDYVKTYPEAVKLMHWDIKWANYKLLTLAKEKVVSIIAKRDTVVNNEPIYGLIKLVPSVRYYEIDDEHPLREKIDELEKVLKEIFQSLVK